MPLQRKSSLANAQVRRDPGEEETAAPEWGFRRLDKVVRIHLRDAVYWGKKEESAILEALGYGGCGGDVPGDTRWWVGDAEAACAVAMVPRRRLPLLFWNAVGGGGRPRQ